MNSINITFPLVDDTEKNKLFAQNSVTNDALLSNLTLLLLTDKGERYYLPEYGTNLKQFIFEPNDSLTETDIEEDIRLTVKEFIPQLTIQRVVFSNSVDDPSLNDNQLNVIIDFTYTEDVFSEVGRLELSF